MLVFLKRTQEIFSAAAIIPKTRTIYQFIALGAIIGSKRRSPQTQNQSKNKASRNTIFAAAIERSLLLLQQYCTHSTKSNTRNNWRCCKNDCSLNIPRTRPMHELRLGRLSPALNREPTAMTTNAKQNERHVRTILMTPLC